ncbi:MAG: thermosome subunit [Marine Group III euryarchaeote CG-Epi4]|uniref:Thermosome subunit n=1 Tax=Marine Group III euryarchaeote CG-Epi4 TaxID=1888998 RepID=A0A1J5TWS6_9ARCH|nr:MAG: thermosome subunit [Marine Group III euryarchaeote CG-Epi4]
MLPGNSPVVILKEGTQRDSGKKATHNNIAAAKAIAEAVRSTLGPKGMDKMLVDSMGDVIITNDGVTILKEVEVQHPAAKMIVEIAKTQDSECGDGTTTAVILAGELLKNAEELMDKGVHPTAISNGYRRASNESLELLDKISRKVSRSDVKTLKSIAITSMTGKSSEANAEFLADLTVNSIKAVAEKKEKNSFEVDRSNIKIQKKQGGSIADTEQVSGIIMDKEPVHTDMPRNVKKAKVALIDAPLEIKKTEIESKIQINDPSQIQAFLDQEESTIKKMVDTISKSGATVLICQKGIDDLAQHFLAKNNIMAIRRAKKSDIDALSKATGGRVISNIDSMSKKDLGFAGLVEVRKIGDDDMTFVTDCKNPKAVSILVRAGSEHVADEIERNLDDAIGVVSLVFKDGKIVTGGGAAEIELALKLRKFAPRVGGREQMAIEAFANAIEVVPSTLAENAGLDVIDTLMGLRKSHTKKGRNQHAGLDAYSGKVVNMQSRNVVEPLRVKTQAVSSATDVATMILRIDDVIASKQPEGPEPDGSDGMGGMGPGMM